MCSRGNVASPCGHWFKMLLVSWNVASWSTAYKMICSQHGSFKEWLSRHKIDILCLQEVKLTTQKLEAESAAVGASIEGYESFWCLVKTQKDKGFNGVATYAPTGCTYRADCRPLGEDELDDEGRCIMTDHGKFIIFNVYVPNASSVDRMRFKMRFLRALQRRMQSERDSNPGKHIILVGDLNIARRPRDCTLLSRRIPLDVLLNKEKARRHLRTKDDHLCSEAQISLQGCWDRVLQALKTRHVKEMVVNKAQGKAIKFMLLVTGPDGTSHKLGGPFETQDDAERAYKFEEGRSIHFADSDGVHDDVVRKPMSMCLGDLLDLLQAVGVNWTQKMVRAVGEIFGESYSAKCTIDWLEFLLQGGTPGGSTDSTKMEMVDTFHELRPLAKDRFTCWNQYTNRRYSNDGCRIDYIIVDRPFFDQYVMVGVPLYGIGSTHKDSMEAARGRSHDKSIHSPEAKSVRLSQGPDNFERAALRAAVAHGLFTAAPFDGSGMADAPATAYECQFYYPHTGMVYTPPQYSDHIGVSLLLDDEALPELQKPAKDRRLRPYDRVTRQCQPHLRQKSIKSFFETATTCKSSSVPMSHTTSKPPLPSSPSPLSSSLLSSSSSLSLSSSSSSSSPSLLPPSSPVSVNSILMNNSKRRKSPVSLNRSSLSKKKKGEDKVQKAQPSGSLLALWGTPQK